MHSKNKNSKKEFILNSTINSAITSYANNLQEIQLYINAMKNIFNLTSQKDKPAYIGTIKLSWFWKVEQWSDRFILIKNGPFKHKIAGTYKLDNKIYVSYYLKVPANITKMFNILCQSS